MIQLVARQNISIVAGEKYHVFNRGVDKRDIFLDKFDYIRFYNYLMYFNTVKPTISYRLAKSSHDKNAKKLVNIIAYSLLPNHYHLIVEPLSDKGLSEFIKRISGSYTSYFNEKNDRSGVLFQGRYKKVHVATDEQFQYLFAYVNENHYVHNINTQRELYHSSSVHYQNVGKSKIINEVRTYNFPEGKQLAEYIYERRSSYKDSLE